MAKVCGPVRFCFRTRRIYSTRTRLVLKVWLNSSKEFCKRRSMGGNFKQFYEFGPFRLESKRPRLRRGDKIVLLSPTELETLLLLVRHAGEVLEPEAFMQTVWA